MEDDELNINELFLQPTKTMPSLTAEAETAVANGKKYNTRTQLWDLDQETEYGFNWEDEIANVGNSKPFGKIAPILSLAKTSLLKNAF